MQMLRLIRAATNLCSIYAPVRGVATYEYRTYGDADGPNYNLIQYLTKEMQREEVTAHGNPYKARAIATAIKSIHGLDFSIENTSQIKNIPGVGEGIARRIMEFLGQIRKSDYNTLSVDDRKELSRSRAMRELQRVNGIGPIKARALVDIGCMSLEQLNESQYLELLPQAAKTSFQYFSAMQLHVTRQQAEKFMTTLREVLPTDFQLYLAGSYRRGRSDISHLDFLLFHPSYRTAPVPKAPAAWMRELEKDSAMPQPKSRRIDSQARSPRTLLQDDVVALLQEKGLIISTLSSGRSNLKWHGIVKLQCKGEELVRRLDISLMPLPSKAAALLTSTGDKEFIRVCRKRAANNNMYLNEFGLWRQTLPHRGRDEGSAQGGWEFVETPNEETLLRELGMGYTIPERRNFENVSMIQKWERNRTEGVGLHQRYPSSSVVKAGRPREAMSHHIGQDRRRSQTSSPHSDANRRIRR